MMPVERRPAHLIDRMPEVRGRMTADVALGRYTWFKVGGPADVLFEPADADDLAQFIAERPQDIPVTMLGVGSNVIIRDGGIEGVVIRLGRSFAEIFIGDDIVIAGAGAHDVTVAREARDAGLTGLEFLAGIPGSIGGALRMNAGAYGIEMKDVVIDAEAIDLDGKRHAMDTNDLAFGYRTCAVPENWIFTGVRLQGHYGDRDAIEARMAEIQTERETTQPIRTPTGGSTFANPEGAKAWQLIDKAGCRGLTRGGARVSDKHCNFLINERGASAADLEGLGEEVRRRVAEQTGVRLEWEIRRLGRLPDMGDEAQSAPPDAEDTP